MHPKSYVALFAMIDQTFNYHYSPKIKEIAGYFDTMILQTKGFKYFENQYLLNTLILSLNVKNSKDENVNIQFVRTDGKYTLIDFWFRGCIGCLNEMKEIKDKYFANIEKKVRLISICTDVLEVVPESIKVLRKLNIPWENYWDYDASSFMKYTNIYVYPSNLLLNNFGYVIAKDLDIRNIDLLFK